MSIVVLLVCILLCGCKNASSKDIESTNQNGEVQNEIVNENKEVKLENEHEMEDVKIETFELEQGKEVGSLAIQANIIGLKEYNSVKSNEYKDIPSENKKYLVMFLQINNNTMDELFFNPDGISATIDGNEIAHVTLVNDPDNYPTIFRNIPIENHAEGFIAWEVPSDWKELQFTFNGFEQSNHIVFRGTLTSEMITNPPERFE